MALPKDIDRVSLQVTQSGHSLLSTESDVGVGSLLLPATFSIPVTTDSSAVTIHAVGYKDHQARVERDAITPIPAGRTGELLLPLDYLCVGTAETEPDGGVSSTCPDGQTCVLGACASPVVPTAALATVGTPGGTDDASVGSEARTSPSGCFDVAACFEASRPAVVDTTSCSVTVPAGTDPAVVNVALQFPLDGAGICGNKNCWIALSGWNLSGVTLQLPGAACQKAMAPGVSIVVSTACDTQGDAMPVCGSWSSSATPATHPPRRSP